MAREWDSWQMLDPWEQEERGREMMDAGECPLTTRELEVLAQLGKGLGVKEAALSLGIAYSTARHHLYAVNTKLGAADRSGAVLLAWAKGWIQVEVPGIGPIEERAPYEGPPSERDAGTQGAAA